MSLEFGGKMCLWGLALRFCRGMGREKRKECEWPGATHKKGPTIKYLVRIITSFKGRTPNNQHVKKRVKPWERKRMGHRQSKGRGDQDVKDVISGSASGAFTLRRDNSNQNGDVKG